MGLDELPEDVRKVLGGGGLESSTVEVIYKNWRGETRPRKIIPLDFHYGNTEWHPDNQLLLRVWDLEKKDYREYAVRDIVEWVRVSGS